MSITFRYTLSPYRGHRKKYNCPACGAKKRFTRYTDTETGLHLHETVGRCDREIKCGYHKTPKQYFAETGQQPMHSTYVYPKPISSRQEALAKPSFMSKNLLTQSLQSPKPNHFIAYLIKLFGLEKAYAVAKRYQVGTSDHWEGATVFWQQDGEGRIRGGKIMLYDPVTGKRVKQPYSHINWMHKVHKLPDFQLQQCLFGEHLLQEEPLKPVAVVESEKTAVIASVYLPQFVWVAVGSLSNLTVERCGSLKGRQVVLFPDLGGWNKWNMKADALSAIAHVKVSDLLERKAKSDEKQDGWDLADYLVQLDWRDF